MKKRIVLGVALGAFLVGALGPRVFGQAPTNPVTIIGVAAGVSLATPVGTAGVPNASVVTVQGVTSMTPLLVTATISGTPAVTLTSTSVAGLLSNNTAAPGASTNMAAMPCVVGASAPSYTDGRLVFARCDTGGAAYVNVANGSTTDSEDASIASGQSSIALTVPLPYRYNGTAFVRERADPCSYLAKTTDPFSLTARGIIVAATASKKNYICALFIVAGAAEIFNVDEGTGTTCQTGTAAISGSTTAANGASFAANGGGMIGSGAATVMAGKTANVDTCIVPSSSNRLAGFVTWVQE